MPNTTTERLVRVMKFNGHGLLEDPESLARLLAPGVSSLPADVAALMVLVETKAVAHLLKWAATDQANKPSYVQMRDHMVAKYAQSGRLSAELARWGLDAWCAALPSVQQASIGLAKPLALEPVPEPIAASSLATATPAATSTTAPVAPSIRSAQAPNSPVVTSANSRRDIELTIEQASTADVDDGFIDSGQMVPFSHGLKWWQHAWRLFWAHPLKWLLMLAIFALSALLTFIPIVGSIAYGLLTPLFIAGFMLGARAIDQGERLTVSYVFAGFKSRPAALLSLALLHFLVLLAVFVSFALLLKNDVATVAKLMLGVQPQSLPEMQSLNSMFFSSMVMLLLAPAYNFAAALIVFNGQTVPSAYLAALKGSLKGSWAGILFLIVLVPAVIVATVPLMLGWLVLTPMCFLSIYAAYNDIFYEKNAAALDNSKKSESGSAPIGEQAFIRKARTLSPVNNLSALKS